MKKIIKLLVAGSLAAVLLVSLAACSSSTPSGTFVLDTYSIVGAFDEEEINISGAIADVDSIEDEFAKSIVADMIGGIGSFEFKFEGSNVTITAEETNTYAFSMNGDKVEIDDEEFKESGVVITFKSDKLTMSFEESGVSVSLGFKKA